MEPITNMNVVETFAGAGGMTEGFEKAGMDTLIGYEIDESACQTFRKNIPAPCLQEDLTEYKPKDAPIDKEQVDVVTGGPPCQDFSVANYYSRGGERTNLVFVFAEWVRHFEPEFFVMENVAGITSVDDVFDELLDEFYQMDFNIDYRVINAKDCGAPQSRNRMIIVGSQEDQPDLSNIGGESASTVGEAFDGLPFIDIGETHPTVPNHRAPNHQQSTLDRISNTDHGEPLFDSWTEKIRLPPDEPAPTLKAGKRANYHFGHPEYPRGLTVRERARLQTFPDDYIFKGTLTEQRTQTGNAVPPIMAKAVAKEILKMSSNNNFDFTQ